MEYKALPFEWKASDDEPGVIEGYAAICGTVDLGGDIIEPGAFRKTIKENPHPPMHYMHNPDQPIGETIEMREDEKGLFVRGRLAINDSVPEADKAYSLIRRKIIRGLSIGYRAIKSAPGDTAGVYRYLKELALMEWSPVSMPMHGKAKITRYKSARELQDALGLIAEAEELSDIHDPELLTKAIDRLMALRTTEPPEGTRAPEPPEAHAEPDMLFHSLVELMREHPTIYSSGVVHERRDQSGIGRVPHGA